VNTANFLYHLFFYAFMGSLSGKIRLRKNAKNKAKDIANARIIRYFDMAEGVFLEDKSLANRYVTLARNTAMKYQVNIPSQYKRKFCKHCYKYLRPGVNASVRTTPGGRGSHVTYTCSECKKHMRVPYLKEKKIRKEQARK
jgi:ribonuclease P protein subunit RPR2